MSSSDPATGPGVLALRPFVPAKDFDRSVRFYVDLGFEARPLDTGLAAIKLGPFDFLLQSFYVEAHAGNFMMQLLVEDVAAWWERIASLDLASRYGVPPPTAPAVQPWGLKVAYVVDPTGVLWHIAESRKR